MQNQEIRDKVSEIVSTALDYNAKNSFKRFFPITTNRHGKIIEYGVYDYQSKKYVLCNSRARSLSDDLIHFEQFVNAAIKIPPAFKKKR